MNNRNDSRDGGSAGDGSLPQEPMECRENVGKTTPDRYPAGEREAGDVSGAANRGRRRSTGSGPVSGSGAGAGGKGNAEDYDSDPQGGGGRAAEPDTPPPGKGADAPVGGSR
ncbi:hypothetical protein [Sphingopyxis sp. USTB-05]|uniref:hypothetical protein n=1 Tax=Sphingopyxis sp. USTB-05 TaxID=2830667 RepID=UPI0020790757|nr:hypothetical protein [Sphingopyxis sp. USTB-05]USI75390.1 hypothetical protein KEC45_11415 [Sphingopyxis sp. USTB-05]